MDTGHRHMGLTLLSRHGRTGYSETLVNFYLITSATSQKAVFFKNPQTLCPV